MCRPGGRQGKGRLGMGMIGLAWPNCGAECRLRVLELDMMNKRMDSWLGEAELALAL